MTTPAVVTSTPTIIRAGHDPVIASIEPVQGVIQPGLYGTPVYINADATDVHFRMAVRDPNGDRTYGASRDPNPNVPQFMSGGTGVDYLRDPPRPKAAIDGDYTVPGCGTYGTLDDLRHHLSYARSIEMIPSDNTFALYIPQMCAQRDIVREREFTVQQDVRNVVRDGKAFIYTTSTGAKLESYYPPETVNWSRGP